MIAGRTLLWNDTRNEVVELGPGGEALWRQTVINPWTGQLLPSGGRLIGTNARALIEFDISGRIVWREDALPGEPRGVLRTRGGKTWVTIPSRNLLLRYRSDGTVDLKRTIEGDPRGLAATADGNVLIALQKAGRIAKLDDAGEMVWKLDGVSSVDSLKELAGGNLLVCQRSLTGSLNRVVELTPGGEEVWSTSEVRSPYAAHRLPSGETVVVDLEGIHRFDADGKRISQERERGYRGASWQ